MIGSLNASTVTAAYLSAPGSPSAEASGAKTAVPAPEQPRSIADAIAGLDASEPIRSASTTLGTLVDTYM
jgi:hypothetical protein